MNGAGTLEAHRRYLAAVLDACGRRPGLHAHQLAAARAELTLAAEGDLASYLADSGDLFELTRAVRLDRLAGQARIAASVGDHWRARAAAGEYVHALGASGHADWPARSAEGSARAEALAAAGAEATAAFTRLLGALLALHGGSPDAGERARFELDLLRAADPGFALDRRPYALRVPWTGAGRAAIATWLAELGAAGEPGEEDDPLATLEPAAAAWRAGLGRRRDPVPRAAAATADDPGSAAQEAYTAQVADGRLARVAAAPLRARAQAALERQAFWPDPLTAHHWRALLDGLDAARTPTEVELVAIHAAACLAVESDWNLLLHGALLAPLSAALAHDLDPDPERAAGAQGLATASHSLTGFGPRALPAHPRVAQLLAEVLPAPDPGPVGADEGEAGFELAVAGRAWRDVVGRPVDAEALEGALDRAGVPEPPSAPRAVTLWGRAIELGELLAALARPARPGLCSVHGGSDDP